MEIFKELSDRKLIRFGLFPILVYFLVFCILTWPIITQFPTHLYGDDQDALSYVWNIWHVDKSLQELQSPWHTTDLHYPHGTTLIGHTLNLTNSLPAALLQNVISLFQAHNLMVIFAFITSGLSAFLLAFYFSGSYWPSIVGGFIYAFSGYQMLHFGSHINLNSIQWIPLFLLFWHKFLTAPKARWAALSTLFLIITFYTELYYFLYCVLAAFIFLAVAVWRRKGFSFIFKAEFLKPFAFFLLLVAFTTGPFLVQFFRVSRVDPLYGAHDIVRFSADLVGPLLPGFLKGWYAGRLELGEGAGESFIGLTVWILLIFVIFSMKKLEGRFPAEWIIIFFTFLILSLGPHLHVFNHDLWAFMPYRFLDNVIPGMSISGVPVRMIVMSTLAAAVIVAIALDSIIKSGGSWRYPVVFLLLLFIALEYLPIHKITPSQPEIDPYVYFIKELPGDGGVFDNRSIFQPLLYQTVHQRPVYDGFITRIPESVRFKDNLLEDSFQTGDMDVLCANGFRYVAVDPDSTIAGASLVFQDSGTKLYDLNTNVRNCETALVNAG